MLVKLLFLLAVLTCLNAQLCINMDGGCTNEGNCINSKCVQCDTADRDVKSDCRCPTSQFYDESTTACVDCDPACHNCSGPNSNECLECPVKEGYGLNHETNECVCIFGYQLTGSLESPCKQCYIYGTQCLATCPSGTEPNNKIMACEGFTEDPLDNDDDIVYIIMTIILIVLAIVLMVLLYRYFHSLFKKIWLTEKDRFLPLSEEEKQYLTNQVEIEKQRKIEAEKREEQKKIDEQRRKEEEERLEKERQEAEKRRLEEEEEERRRLAEEEERRLEEERLRKEAEAEALRQMELEREKQEQERLERERREAEERERIRLKELAIKARQERQMQRQMTRQATMAANEQKLKEMREQRALLQKEKEEMETYNARCIEDAERIEGQKGDIASRLEKARLRRQETLAVKQGIMTRQATIASQKKELDSALEGIDFASALQKVQNIQQEDVVFLQNLRTPPERIRLCLEAVVMLLKGTTKPQSWEDIKKDISNMTFRRSMLTYDPEAMSDKVFNKIYKEYTNNPQWNLNKIHKASPAAGAFAEWLDATVSYKKIKVENAPLFEKIKILKQEETAMQGDIDKLEGLEQEEESYQKEEENMNNELGGFDQKQSTLKKQATLNLGDIKDREEKINKLNTGDLSLEEIAESDEEDDSGSDLSPEEMEILKGV